MNKKNLNMKGKRPLPNTKKKSTVKSTTVPVPVESPKTITHNTIIKAKMIIIIKPIMG